MASPQEQYERLTLMYMIYGVRDGKWDCWFTRTQSSHEAELAAKENGIDVDRIETFASFAYTKRIEFIPSNLRVVKRTRRGKKKA